MTKTEVSTAKPRSLAKGLIAGCIGGLAGALAKTLAERMFPPESQEKLLAGPGSEPAAERALAPVATDDGIRWGFGALTGAAYGALVEYVPAAAAKDGASLGIALGVLTQEASLPGFGASVASEDGGGKIPPLVAYGVTTEFVRRWVRKAL